MDTRKELYIRFDGTWFISKRYSARIFYSGRTITESSKARLDNILGEIRSKVYDADLYINLTNRFMVITH